MYLNILDAKLANISTHAKKTIITHKVVKLAVNFISLVYYGKHGSESLENGFNSYMTKNELQNSLLHRSVHCHKKYFKALFEKLK